MIKFSEKNLRYINLEESVIETNGTVGIYNHLTSKAQELFNRGKELQKMNGYAYCWTKNSTNLLKETEDLSSKIIKVTNTDVLNNLKISLLETLVLIRLHLWIVSQKDHEQDL